MRCDECLHLTDSVGKLFVGSLLRANGSKVSAGDFFNRMGAKRTFKPTDAWHDGYFVPSA